MSARGALDRPTLKRKLDATESGSGSAPSGEARVGREAGQAHRDVIDDCGALTKRLRHRRGDGRGALSASKSVDGDGARGVAPQNRPHAPSVTTQEAQATGGSEAHRLVEWLRSVGCEEKPETLKRHHERVLHILHEIVNHCVALHLENYGLTPEMIAQSAVHMRTFGSYRMGVDSAGSDNDIDVLFIGGRYIDRAGFFLRLQSAFERDTRVTSVKYLPDAHVPLIKIDMLGTHMDILYAQLAATVVSEPFDIASDQHLVGMDVKSQLSINGARVADLMIDAMPDAVLFRTTLRVVKHWAKRRGIYSNIHGYLGGFSWALLTSYVCLSNVRCRTAPEMVVAFFRTFAFWNWAQDPVCLVSPTVDHPLRLPDWRLNHHPASMTVLTPAYPNNNSTFNVRPMTAETIVSELKRAHEFLAPCALTNHAGFVDLLATVCIPSAFFKSYRSFIEVHMTAQNESDLKTW